MRTPVGSGLWRFAGLGAATVPLAILFAAPNQAKARVTFGRDVAPIFKAHCVSCHGGANAAAGLDLATAAGIARGGNSGRAIVLGHPERSLLLQRIEGKGGKPAMPLGFPPLSAEDTAKISDWIAAGAPSDSGGTVTHWAYVAPVRPTPPSIKSDWVRNPIDAFILARLRKEDLNPAPEAPKEILLRRASLDLTGLPPTPEQLDAFLADHSANAYEKVVDRLLASPHYGEQQARGWLDLSRYADTDGYEKDLRRVAWVYRDWVVDAFNANMPYDEFTIKQIAGDLLPNATVSDRVATGFHRNTMLNLEGGVDQAEAHFAVITDRVDTTATVWLGSTLGCARCHDHKYDPFTQRDYYRMAAFFNNTIVLPRGPKEVGEEKWFEPTIQVPTPEQTARREALNVEIHELKRQMQAPRADLEAAYTAWMQSPTASAPARIQALRAATRRSAAEEAELVAYFRGQTALLAATRTRLGQAGRELAAVEASIPTALVLQEPPAHGPLTCYMRDRGEFLSKTELVTAGTPAVLPSMPDGRANRLALAKWLVDRRNPLTARVEVNRIWEQFFGRGIVETSEDFGTRGSSPTHPELLDWLACQFMAKGWDMKAIHRLIALSSTYRQSSDASPTDMAKDPQNIYLSRGARFRLSAETIRDNALAVAGLLSLKMHGPSVFPYQPEGIWDSPYNGDRWTNSTGEDAYRRSLYTFWKRTAPYPAFITFDATSREACTVRRVRTNTPLQALTLLNDAEMMSAAAALADRMLAAGPSPSARLAEGFRLCTARRPHPEELARLEALLNRVQARYAKDPKAAQTLMASVHGSDLGKAPWTMVGNVLLNLDETITKE